MGLFDNTLIEKEVQISLAENLLIDLCGEIEAMHEDLMQAMNSHGIDSVATCIELIINRLSSSKKYVDLDVKPTKYDSDFKFKFVTVIKNNLYVVIRTGAIYQLHQYYNTDKSVISRFQSENKGEIFVTLDGCLRIIKRKFKPYERL